MFQANFIVIDIVSRRNFQSSCTKFNIYIFIFDDRNYPTYHRNNYFFASQMFITLIIRIYTNGYVSKNSFRASSCYSKIFLRIFNFIYKVKKLSVLFFIDYFFIRKSGFSLWVPINHTIPSVDKSFVIQIYKNLNNRLIQIIIHCEFGALPITRTA